MKQIDDHLLYQAAQGVSIALQTSKKYLVQGNHEFALEILHTIGRCHLLDLIKHYDGPLPLNWSLYEWQFHDLLKQIRSATPKTIAAQQAGATVIPDLVEKCEKLAFCCTEILSALSPRPASSGPVSQTG